MTDTLYKVLHTDGRCYNGGRGSWPVPNGKPGGWVQTALLFDYLEGRKVA